VNTNTLAGPGGLIIAFLLMSLIAIAVGECLGELVIKFPVYNAINVYVKVFIDPDLAWVTSIAYCKSLFFVR
jgi:amino acid transporter